MTSQNSNNGRSLRRAATGVVLGAALATGLITAVSPVASAQPADTTQAGAKPPVSPDQILSMISQQYQSGAGGGQVSNLIDQVMTLRMRGVKPSRANAAALADALDKRPNQLPLIQALQTTLTYQRTQLARAGTPPIGGAPPVMTPGSPQLPMGPSWGPGNPMQQDQDTIFPMPGR